MTICVAILASLRLAFDAILASLCVCDIRCIVALGSACPGATIGIGPGPPTLPPPLAVSNGFPCHNVLTSHQGSQMAQASRWRPGHIAIIWDF